MKHMYFRPGHLLAAVLCFTLAACSSSPEETAKDIQRKQRELEYEQQTNYMKATRKAIFKEEAVFQDNCKVGEMYWIDNNGYRSRINAVICDGLPTTNVQYRVGKSGVASLAIVGEPVDEVTRAKKILEEDKKRTEAEAKAKVLEKLSPEERKALGL